MQLPGRPRDPLAGPEPGSWLRRQRARRARQSSYEHTLRTGSCPTTPALRRGRPALSATGCRGGPIRRPRDQKRLRNRRAVHRGRGTSQITGEAPGRRGPPRIRSRTHRRSCSPGASRASRRPVATTALDVAGRERRRCRRVDSHGRRRASIFGADPAMDRETSRLTCPCEGDVRCLGFITSRTTAPAPRVQCDRRPMHRRLVIATQWRRHSR